MIVLDTNQLEYAQPPNGPLLTMLKTVSSQLSLELCVPEMAFDEHIAHFRHEVREQWLAVSRSRSNLMTLVQFWPGEVTPFDVEAAVSGRKQCLLKVVRVLTTPAWAANEALR